MKSASLVAAAVLVACLVLACKSETAPVSSGGVGSQLRQLIDLPLGVTTSEVATSIGHPTEDVGSGVCIWRYEIPHRGLVILWFDMSNKLQSVCAYWQSEDYETEATQALMSRVAAEMRAATLVSAAHPDMLKVSISEATELARGSRWDRWIDRGAVQMESGAEVCALARLREGGFVKLIKGAAEDVDKVQIVHSQSNQDGERRD